MGKRGTPAHASSSSQPIQSAGSLIPPDSCIHLYRYTCVEWYRWYDTDDQYNQICMIIDVMIVLVIHDVSIVSCVTIRGGVSNTGCSDWRGRGGRSEFGGNTHSNDYTSLGP